MLAHEEQARAAEHGVLLRHWAGLQARVSRQCEAQQRHCAALEAELMRWRARWVVASTQLLWGLGWPCLTPSAIRLAAQARLQAVDEAPAPAEQAGQAAPAVHAAAQVMCETGCTGHAHAWRDEAGQCRLSGRDCERVPPRAAGV